MTFKELKNFVNMIPEEMDEFEVVNGEKGPAAVNVQRA